MVLSPNSARKNATLAATTALRVPLSAASTSSSSNESPRKVQAAKARNATPATMAMVSVGIRAPRTAPIPTLIACVNAVAIVIPNSTGHGL